MAAKYEVTLNYTASITVTVDADDEGMALDKARNMAEDADINQFNLGIERESVCNCIGDGRHGIFG